MRRKVKIIVISFIMSIVLFLCFIYIRFNFDPIIPYEKAWKTRDKSFFLKKIAALENADKDRLLNEVSRINVVVNCYLIEASEIKAEKDSIKNYTKYRQNILFALTNYILSPAFYDTTSNFYEISFFRIYNRSATLKEKITLIKRLNKSPN